MYIFTFNTDTTLLSTGEMPMYTYPIILKSFMLEQNLKKNHL